MLTLRLVRGGLPFTLLCRLLVACATAVVSYLLLAALGHALAHPERSVESAARLLWCLLPLAAAVQFAAATARLDPGSRSRTALAAAGVGPVRVPLLAALTTAASCLLGSGTALLVYLQLRGRAASMPLEKTAVEAVSADAALPKAAVLTLLCVVPLVAACAAAFATWTPAVSAVPAGSPMSPSTGSAPSRGTARNTVPAPAAQARTGVKSPAQDGSREVWPSSAAVALPWGAALIAAGIAMETYAAGSARPMPLDAVLLSGSAPGIVGGWLLATLGLLLVTPGLTRMCGLLLSAGAPGALRLLSGRMLARDARRLGRPLGVLCTVAAGVVTVTELSAGTPQEQELVLGPLPALGAALVVCCVTASVLSAAAATRASRAPTTAVLRRLGASARLLGGMAALRTGVLFAVLGPLAWAVGELSAYALHG